MPGNVRRDPVLARGNGVEFYGTGPARRRRPAVCLGFLGPSAHWLPTKKLEPVNLTRPHWAGPMAELHPSHSDARYHMQVFFLGPCAYRFANSLTPSRASHSLACLGSSAPSTFFFHHSASPGSSAPPLPSLQHPSPPHTKCFVFCKTAVGVPSTIALSPIYSSPSSLFLSASAPSSGYSLLLPSLHRGAQAWCFFSFEQLRICGFFVVSLSNIVVFLVIPRAPPPPPSTVQISGFNAV